MGTKERMKLKDTIVLLNEDAPSLTGASTLKRDKLIIKVRDNTVYIPIKSIKLLIFKENAHSFGFLYKGCIYSGRDCDGWNNFTKKVIGRELKPSFDN